MKKINVILVVLLIIFTSCRTKKITTITTTNDSVRTNKVIKITPKQLNSVFIDSPCDSLGNLKSFSYTFVSDKIKTSLKAINDTIYLEQNIDSIVDVRVKEFKSSFKSKEEVKEIDVTPAWAWKSVILNIIFGLWIFRKPLIKLIKPI